MSVEENKLSTVIGQLSSVDEDPADQHVYSINDPSGLFVIDGDLLKVYRIIDPKNYHGFPRTLDFNVCVELVLYMHKIFLQVFLTPVIIIWIYINQLSIVMMFSVSSKVC